MYICKIQYKLRFDFGQKGKFKHEKNRIRDDGARKKYWRHAKNMKERKNKIK